MRITVERVERLRFDDGEPVRAASAVAALGASPEHGDGFVVVQDDATHGAWFRGQEATRVRLLPAADGLETFDDAAGTKHLKPDLEAACQVDIDGVPGVLLLGSGSSPARMRWSLLRLDRDGPRSLVADMTPLYAVVAGALGVAPDVLNMEGACLLGTTLRWYQRGLPSAGVPTASVDLDLQHALDAVLGRLRPDEVAVTDPRHYLLGRVAGVGLAITDAVALPDGAVLVSAAAEDSPNTRDDGPVVGSALVLLDGAQARHVVPLPRIDGVTPKVEGLMVLEADADSARLLAVADADDPATPSVAMWLRVDRWT